MDTVVPIRSLSEQIALLPQEEREAFVTSLDDYQAFALRYLWSFWARKSQLPPPGDWWLWLFKAGRGSGKTRSAAEWICEKAETPSLRLGLVAETAADVRDVVVEGQSGILACAPPWNMPKYEPTKRRLTWPNGTMATTYSGDAPDQLRGPQHHYVWGDEIAKWRYADDAWANLELGLRLGDRPQVVATTTPRPIPLLKEWVTQAELGHGVVMTQDTTYANVSNLAPGFIQRVLRRYEGTRLGRQELYAELLEDTPGALWTSTLLEQTRVAKLPELVRAVVGIDPPGGLITECGIIVGGLGVDGHGYVFDDLSLPGSPGMWGNQVVSAYTKYKLDRACAETNHGGEMVIATIEIAAKNAGVTVATKKLYASRGKYARAEPIAALFEQNRCHMVGTFGALEDELTSWVPNAGLPSPNRLDGMTWMLFELMLDASREPLDIASPDLHQPSRWRMT